MKRSNLLITALMAAVLVGCGGGSDVAQQQVQADAPPPAVQKMMGSTQVRQGSAVLLADAKSNIVTIAGYRDQFTVTKDQTTKVVTLTNKISKEVSTYSDPSLIKFFDKYTSFDIDGAPGQVYRLYQAAFNRKPDISGLGFWIYANANGNDMLNISSAFITSAEFQTTYGTDVGNSKFIGLLYNNVLHRAGEKAGLDWWTSALDGGAVRPGVLTGFSESAENKTNLLPDLINGFDYTPFNTGGPIIPKRNSYANAKGQNLTSQKIPSFPYNDQYGEGATGGVAFADFLQNGQQSLVVFTNRWSRDASKANPVGAIHFYQYVNGEPVEVTSKLLADTTGCVSPRRLIVADFNNDGKPDVFAACHGAEFGPYAQWPGEVPRILLSQPDGTYKNVAAPLNCYCHAATAGDINSDGAVDILVSDMNASRDGRASLMALMNDGKGNFTVVKADEKEFINRDANYMMGDKAYYNAFLTLDLIDFDGDGKLDLFMGSGEKTQATLILKGDADGKFMTIMKQFPLTAVEQQVIDVVYVNGIMYELTEQPNAAGDTPGMSIRKYAADMKSYTVIYNSLIKLGTTDNPLFLMPYNNKLVAFNAQYTASATE